MTTRGRLLTEVAVVAALHALACVVVRCLGFDHVSDDDFARVTIAQSFAHTPKLDPSGTSWLPFPFWALGSVMLVAGRSLAMARAASIAFASAAAVLPYVALRMTGTDRRAALLALAFAILSPWSVWLGAATVPESFTASFTAAAAIALGSMRGPRLPLPARIAFALALLAACLSRYEPWPVAAVLGVTLAVRGMRGLRGSKTARDAAASGDTGDLLVAAIVAAGPLLWMAWNGHAHGDALHFFERVARFKRALGEPATGTLDALLLYPRLFVMRRPDVVVALALAFTAGHVFVKSRAEVRSAWLVPLACAAAEVAFLAYGNARDGAPAHHSERALLGVMFLTAMFAADVLVLAAPAALARARAPALAVAGLVAAAWLVNGVIGLRDVPGSGPNEDRSAQIAAGSTLRAENVEHVEVTPCAYEHFALVAAFAAPEKVAILPRTDAVVTPSCPAVERR
ncbi:MAG: hypothetical protein JWO86_208 [Myxococcaceae bacterium]|nr:hypothetical protein [Myxococcaceae bacterium]MEA2752381.1 hypothetical protein [Myxococcales bacterium]